MSRWTGLASPVSATEDRSNANVEIGGSATKEVAQGDNFLSPFFHALWTIASQPRRSDNARRGADRVQ